MDVDDHRAVLEVDHELRQRRQRLLEEHRDVLDRQALDRHPVAVRARGQRAAAAEGVREAREVEAADGRMEELATQVLGPVGVEQDPGDVVEQDDPVAGELDQVVDIRAPRPLPDQRGVRPGSLGQRVRREALGTGLAQGSEEAQLEAREHVPRPVEAAEADHELVEPVVQAHGRIVTCCPGVSGCHSSDGMQPSRRRPCSGS